MAEHIEWADADYTVRTMTICGVGEMNDGTSQNTKPALLVDTGSSGLVIEGSFAELRQFADRILTLVEKEERASRGQR